MNSFAAVNLIKKIIKYWRLLKLSQIVHGLLNLFYVWLSKLHLFHGCLGLTFHLFCFCYWRSFTVDIVSHVKCTFILTAHKFEISLALLVSDLDRNNDIWTTKTNSFGLNQKSICLLTSTYRIWNMIYWILFFLFHLWLLLL